MVLRSPAVPVIIDFNKYTDKKNCIGRPTCNAKFVFIGEDGTPVQATKENPGRLASAGGMNMVGYYREPELFVVMKDGVAFDQAAIIQFLKGQLENYKVPKLVVELEQLPRSSNGKILT